MDRKQFEHLVADALDELPEEFRQRLENVEVVIEDEPSPGLLREMQLDPRRDVLFGLYQGIPLNDREAAHGMSLPDKITIFYRPLVRHCRSPGAIRREIVKTVVHEVGHFFGMEDDEISAFGY